MYKTIFPKHPFIILLVLISALALTTPYAAFADMRPVFNKIEQTKNQYLDYGQFPKSETAKPRKSFEVVVTAYSSEPWQTDDTPFITASGTRVRDGVVAANFLPIGARVRFPELYGEKVFIVEDRMNKRYTYRADIWMSETEDAIKFGCEYTTVEIF